MRLRLVMAVVVLLGSFVFARNQQQPDEPVTDKELLMRPAMVVGAPALPVDMAFMIAMDRAHAPGGAVILHGCEEPARKVVHYQGNALQDVLNNLVADDSEYRWDVRDGVVNLTPVTGLPNLLKLRIASFDSGDASALATAGAYLLALPEVRGQSREMGFSQGIVGNGLYAVPPPGTPATVQKLLAVHLQNVTLFAAFNALVRANGHGEWIYHETHCQSENNFQVVFPD